MAGLRVQRLQGELNKLSLWLDDKPPVGSAIASLMGFGTDDDDPADGDSFVVNPFAEDQSDGDRFTVDTFIGDQSLVQPEAFKQDISDMVAVAKARTFTSAPEKNPLDITRRVLGEGCLCPLSPGMGLVIESSTGVNIHLRFDTPPSPITIYHWDLYNGPKGTESFMIDVPFHQAFDTINVVHMDRGVNDVMSFGFQVNLAVSQAPFVFDGYISLKNDRVKAYQKPGKQQQFVMKLPDLEHYVIMRLTWLTEDTLWISRLTFIRFADHHLAASSSIAYPLTGDNDLRVPSEMHAGH